jgi:hypothetical protein
MPSGQTQSRAASERGRVNLGARRRFGSSDDDPLPIHFTLRSALYTDPGSRNIVRKGPILFIPFHTISFLA